MKKHTPLPWAKDFGGTFGHIKSVGNCGTCGSDNSIPRTPTVLRYDMHEFITPFDEQEGNAELVVKSVNYHDRLVSLVRDALEIENEFETQWDIDARALLKEIGEYVTRNFK